MSPHSTAEAPARACWVVAPGRAELRDEVLPPLAEGQVRVRSLHSGVSRGTEGLVFRGEVPPSEYERMRAPFQQGAFPGPVKYGYVSVGTVEHGPAALQGRTVFCLHPHQTRFQVPADAVLPLPDSVPPGRAVLAALLETAINALWDAAPRIGDRVAVVGGGTLGLLVAWLAARVPGCRVQVVDTVPARAEVAAALGAGFALPDAATPEADLVVHASGQAAGLATALGLAGVEATVLELSWYGSRAVAVPLGAGLPRAPAAAAELAGRQRGAGAARALEPPAPAGAGAVAAGRPGARPPDHAQRALRHAAAGAGAAGRASRRRRHPVPAHRLPTGRNRLNPAEPATPTARHTRCTPSTSETTS